MPPFSANDKTRRFFSRQAREVLGQDALEHTKEMDTGRSGYGNGRRNGRRNGRGKGNKKQWGRRGGSRPWRKEDDDDDKTPRWDASRIDPAAPPPALTPDDHDAIFASATFTSPFCILVSKAAPKFSSKVPGVATKRLQLYQHVVFQGWRVVVAGHLYVDVTRDADGGWVWTPQDDALHGIFLSLYLHMSGSMTSVQNKNAWNVFAALIADDPAVSPLAARVRGKSSEPIFGIYPGDCSPDPRVPCRDVVAADAIDAPDAPGPSTSLIATPNADTDADATDTDNADVPDQ